MSSYLVQRCENGHHQLVHEECPACNLQAEVEALKPYKQYVETYHPEHYARMRRDKASEEVMNRNAETYKKLSVSCEYCQDDGYVHGAHAGQMIPCAHCNGEDE